MKSKKYKAVSLSSGAARGIFQLGALHAAQTKNLLSDVEVWSGTSVGSIIALLMAVGWNAIDIFTHICTDDITEHLDFSIDINQAFKSWGVFDTTSLKAYLHKMIVHKYGGIPTFENLYKEGITFVCTSYKLRNSNPRVFFSHETHPTMSVLDAVMLSSNIPFLFRAASYDGDYYLDGGCFCLNPAEYIAEKYLKDDECLLSVSLDLRHADTEEVVDSLIAYVKEVAFLPMYAQEPIQSSQRIDALNINSHEDAKHMAVHVVNKVKIKWFCSGLEQGLRHFEN
ncbi:MAG: patatin-like phospholipase family protein [Alphaproteobacteria bacterium]|nr:patatin-like phospholipase family protein [Alphaproteobacteria bacterium]